MAAESLHFFFHFSYVSDASEIEKTNNEENLIEAEVKCLIDLKTLVIKTSVNVKLLKLKTCIKR